MGKLLTVFVYLFFATIKFAFGEMLPPIQNGDSLVFEIMTPTQAPGSPIVFEKKPDRTLIITMPDGGQGNRVYTYQKSGKPFAVTNSFITKIEDKGVVIEEQCRFRHFPSGEFPMPGKKWSVEFKSPTKTTNQISLDATATEGPAFPVIINGKENLVRTVRINYDGRVTSPDWDSNGAKIVAEILFAPELQEIVYNQFVSYDRSGFLNKGYRTTLRAINRPPSN